MNTHLSYSIYRRVYITTLIADILTGFSDPFLVISINKERKFTTSVRKKTLNPRWDEWVTLQLPEADDKIDIVRVCLEPIPSLLNDLCIV